MSVKLTAVKQVRYGPDSYEPGQVFRADKKHALVLVATGLARHGGDEDEGVAVVPAAGSRRRRYRRRDMTAEGSHE